MRGGRFDSILRLNSSATNELGVFNFSSQTLSLHHRSQITNVKTLLELFFAFVICGVSVC
jgi:hypothetical protein